MPVTLGEWRLANCVQTHRQKRNSTMKYYRVDKGKQKSVQSVCTSKCEALPRTMAMYRRLTVRAANWSHNPAVEVRLVTFLGAEGFIIVFPVDCSRLDKKKEKKTKSGMAIQTEGLNSVHIPQQQPHPACVGPSLATTISPVVPLSRRCTMPGRSTPG